MIDVKEIKRRVNIKDALQYYGVRFNSKGFAHCPFHREKTPSFHTKGEHFYCFSCGAKGDVVQFVQILYGLPFKEAMKKIDVDFSLGLGDGTYRPSYEEKRLNTLIEEAEKKMQQREEHIYEVYITEIKALEKAMKVVEGETAQMLMDRIMALEEDLNDPAGTALIIRYENEKESRW